MYELLQASHWLVSRLILAGAGGLCLIALGLIARRLDVPRWLRRIAYSLSGLIGLQSVLGLLMYAQGGRALEPDIHLVYGVGITLILPFFIYVEKTAEKRPATAGYLVGGFLLLGLTVRGILTGG